MRRRSEAGSASIYVLAGCLLIGVAAIVPLVTVADAVARHRAAVAADTAALAGARTLAETGSTATACLRAAALAGANDSRLSSCMAEACTPPATASLQVAATVVVAFGRLTGGVSVTARAGPPGCLAHSPPADDLAKSPPVDGARRSLRPNRVLGSGPDNVAHERTVHGTRDLLRGAGGAWPRPVGVIPDARVTAPPRRT